MRKKFEELSKIVGAYTYEASLRCIGLSAELVNPIC